MNEGFEFLWPWVFFLLPLPLIVYFFIPAASENLNNGLWTPFHKQLEKTNIINAASRKNNIGIVAVLSAIWVSLLLAAAGPQFVSEEIEMPVQARDIMLAVDISGSMKEQDMRLQNQRVRRIDLVKDLLGDFIERRQGDRLGLIVFGTKAFLHAPLTFDLTTINTYLDELEIGFAGNNTAIGDALGLAIKTLKERPSKQRILILLTDGSNTAGSIDPLEAAKLAKQESLKIYTIGVGSDGGSNSSSIFGQLFNSSRGAEIDENSLIEIAELTNGQYFRAKNAQQLQDIYSLLDKLEPLEQNKNTFKLQTPLSHWPLLLSLVLLSLLTLFHLFKEHLPQNGLKHG